MVKGQLHGMHSGGGSPVLVEALQYAEVLGLGLLEFVDVR